MGKNVLGRGLEALISSKPLSIEEEASKEKTEEKVSEGAINLAIADIITSSNQPRSEFNKEKMMELVMSIKEKGVVEPILVRAKGNKYELIAGERRWRAAKEAGLYNIPAIIRNVSDREALEISLIENIQRADLNPVEEAKAYQLLIEQFKISQEEIAKAVGKDRSTVANTIRLLKLPEEIQAELKKENLTMGHARALLSLEDPIRQKMIFRRVLRKGLSVRETEDLVRSNLEGPRKRLMKEKDIYLDKIAEELKLIFGTKVSVTGNTNRGKIEIKYYSSDDLSRFLDILEIKL